MKIVLLDDEPILLREGENAVRAAVPDAEIRSFSLGADLLSAIETEGLKPDVVFTDIEMPGISGLELAVRVKSLCPDTRIVFVTGYSQYAVEAFRLRAHGYVMKPLTPERVREELDALPEPRQTPPDRLQVRCFGRFEVFFRGEPVLFSRKQSKELFAFLVNNVGAACAAEEIAAALWEDEEDLTAAKGRIRLLLSDLRATLRAIGMEKVLIRSRRQLAVRRELLDCDYYRLLDNDPEAINAFRGEYMTQYSWTEQTAGTLYFRFMNQ